MLPKNQDSEAVLEGSTQIFEKCSPQFCISRLDLHSFQTKIHFYIANGYKHLSVIQSRGEADSERAAEPGPSTFDGPLPLIVGIVSVPR